MRITAIEEYGLRCLLQLAHVGPEGQLSIAEIAERESLSVPYTSKLLAILRREGLVVAVRGRSGGFSIARPANEINLFDVMTALGGPLVDENYCKKFSGTAEVCVHLGDCAIHDVFGGLAGYVQRFLASTTLDEMFRRRDASKVRQAAHIVTQGQDRLPDKKF